MLPRLLILLLLAAGIVSGGYYAYNNYYLSPEKVLLKTSEQFSKLQTVHAEMDISTTGVINQQGVAVTQDSKISGFSDINLQDHTQKIHMTVSVAANSLEMDIILLKGGEMYMKMPVFGQDWISLNTQTLKVQGGKLPIDPQSNDYVAQSLGFLKSVNKGSIIKLEDEVVDGAKTSHFRVDISTPQYLEYLKQSSAGSSLADSFKDATIKTDLWIDKKTNYVVKMESVIKNVSILDKKTNASLGSADVTMKIGYSKYNQTVSIAKPEGNIIDYNVFMQDRQNKKQPAAQTAQAAPTVNCKNLNIREGEFASNKCYSPQDYDDLNYYLGAFNNAAASYNGAISSMQITCNGSDFFKNQCEQDKKTKDQAQQNIDKYRGIIKGIIAKGS